MEVLDFNFANIFFSSSSLRSCFCIEKTVQKLQSCSPQWEVKWNGKLWLWRCSSRTTTVFFYHLIFVKLLYLFDHYQPSPTTQIDGITRSSAYKALLYRSQQRNLSALITFYLSLEAGFFLLYAIMCWMNVWMFLFSAGFGFVLEWDFLRIFVLLVVANNLWRNFYFWWELA